MRFHRTKMIMGGGVCLLIALTGGVAAANVVAPHPADTIIETRDTAEVAVSSIATIDVATIDKPKNTCTSSESESSTSSKKTNSEPKSVATTSSHSTTNKTTSEHKDVDTSSQVIANQEPECVDITYQIVNPPEADYEYEYEDVDTTTDSQETDSEAITDEDITSSAATSSVATTAPVSSWDGPVLTSFAGIIQGPSGSETYYNLNMSGVISIMKSIGYDYDYWVRADGVKMYGEYVMCAADLNLRPRGSIIETSLGPGIVCDTGGFTTIDPYRLDIAVTW